MLTKAAARSLVSRGASTKSVYVSHSVRTVTLLTLVRESGEQSYSGRGVLLRRHDVDVVGVVEELGCRIVRARAVKL